MKQITILVDDRPGVVADISTILADKNINIETIDAEAQDQHGIITLTVDQYDEALRLLKNARFTAISEDAVVIKLKDEPGALAKIAIRFKEADLSLKSIRIIKREKGFSLAAVSAENMQDVKKLVADVLI
jgi:hypothetical protein